MKKIGIIVGAIVGVLFLAVLIVPMVYDVNQKVRPQIIQAIEENMNAKAEVGKLSLSLWGGIYVGVESLKIIDSTDQSVVFAMKDAKLAIPLSALLSGKIAVTVIADGPVLNVVKEKNGKLNFARLMKSEGSAKPDEKSQSGSASGGSGGAGRILISTRVTNAQLSYRDLVTGSASKIDQLNLEMNEVGLNRPFDVKLGANLNVRQEPETLVQGLLKLDGTVNVGSEKGVDLKAKLDLDELAIKYGTLFNKEPKVPLFVTTDLTLGADRLDLRSLDVVVSTFKISTQGSVENFAQPKVDISVKSNKLDIGEWKKILEPVRKFDASGGVEMDMKFTGPVSNLAYSGRLTISDVNMKVPGVIPRAENVHAQVLLKNDVVELQGVGLKFASSDLELNGQVRDFSAPKITVALNSKNLNLDEMLGESKAPPEAAKEAKEKSAAQKDADAEAAAKGPIHQIKSNATLRKLVFHSKTKIDKLTMSKAPITNLLAQLDFENLVLSLKDAHLNAFGGSVDSKLSVDFNGAEPSYKISGKVKDLDIDAAVTSQFAELKGFIKGKTFADMNLSGSGVAPSKVKANLRGNGGFELKNGEWSGLTPLKLLGEKLKSIPQIKDKAAGVVIGNKFKQLKGQFEIKDSKLILNNVVAELEDVKTSLTANGFVAFNKTMHLNGTAIVPMAGAPKGLATSDGRAKIPFEVEGDCMSPTPKYEATLGPVAKAFFEDEGKKILKNKVNELKDQLPEGQVKDLIKGISF